MSVSITIWCCQFVHTTCKHIKSSTIPWSVLCERGRSENFDGGTEQSSWKNVTKHKWVKLQHGQGFQ